MMTSASTFYLAAFESNERTSKVLQARSKGKKSTKKGDRKSVAPKKATVTKHPVKSNKENKSPKCNNNVNRCPYSGRNPSKDRLPKGAPETELYFKIRETCNKDHDNVDALRKLLPKRESKGKDFMVWPRQHLLLHGLVKQGCVECVRYLLTELKFDINQPRQKDGCVPLHIAFFNLQGRKLDMMADLLVQLGANDTIKNKWGEPPCMFKFKESSLPTRGFWMPTQEKSSALSKLGVQDSPTGVMDLLEQDIPDASFDLGPPATPTPRSSKGQGRMFTQAREPQTEGADDDWEITGNVSLSFSTYKATTSPLNASANAWQQSKKQKGGTTQRPHPAWTGRTINSVFKSNTSSEMYSMVLNAAMDGCNMPKTSLSV
jgi:hypothetical protein